MRKRQGSFCYDKHSYSPSSRSLSPFALETRIYIFALATLLEVHASLTSFPDMVWEWAHLAFLVTSESVFIFIPPSTGIAQEA